MSEILINGKAVEFKGSVLTEDTLTPYRKMAKEIKIGDSVTKIGNWALLNFRMLESVKISNSVTNIGTGAFGNCMALKEISIPSSVTDMGDVVFGGACAGIKIKINSMKGFSERTFCGYSGQSLIIAFHGDEYPLLSYYTPHFRTDTNGIMVVTGFVDYAKGKIYHGYKFNNEFEPLVKEPVYCYIFKENALSESTAEKLKKMIDEVKY